MAVKEKVPLSTTALYLKNEEVTGNPLLLPQPIEHGELLAAHQWKQQTLMWSLSVKALTSAFSCKRNLLPVFIMCSRCIHFAEAHVL